jgi:hypothetical protein
MRVKKFILVCFGFISFLCSLREEVPGSGYLSASTPLAKARLSEGREMLEV